MFKFLRKKHSWAEAETLLTPIEVAADRLAWRHFFKNRIVPPAAGLKRYERTVIAPNVLLFSAGVGAQTLIVALCCRKRRLMMPIAMVLQHIDDRRYDVLVISDPRDLHYDRGVSGFADSMPALAKRIRSIAAERGYATLITYGTSMGGLPALRLGMLLNVSRAISCGGLFPWHVKRLLGARQTISAFDPICACRAPIATPCYLLFSDQVQEDMSAAARICAIVPTAVQIPVPSDTHNFPIRMYRQGNCTEYFRRLFDLDSEPDADRLAAMAQ